MKKINILYNVIVFIIIIITLITLYAMLAIDDLAVNMMSKIEYMKGKEISILLKIQDIPTNIQLYNNPHHNNTYYDNLNKIYYIKGDTIYYGAKKVLNRRLEKIEEPNMDDKSNRECNSIVIYFLLRGIKADTILSKWGLYEAPLLIEKEKYYPNYTINNELKKDIKDLVRTAESLYNMNQRLIDKPIIGSSIFMILQDNVHDQWLKNMLNKHLQIVKRHNPKSYKVAEIFHKISNILRGSFIHSKYNKKQI